MRKFIAALALISLIAIPQLTQSATAACIPFELVIRR